MRLLFLEMKRVLRTRITWILLLFALGCSILFAYIPTTFIYCTDESDITVKGMQAIAKYKEIRADNSGEVTPEKIKNALESVKTILKENNATGVYELPNDVYQKNYLPRSPFIHGVLEIYANPETGMAPELLNIDSPELDNYYEDCDARLASLMKQEQPKNTAAWCDAEEKYADVSKPYLYYSGITSDAMDYESLLLFLILICCAMIAAPVFSSDYQTEADSILRCTKYGRFRLAVTKILSALIISGVSLCVCASLWIVITNSLFGWDSVKTSVQILYSITSLVPWNIGQLQLNVAFVGILSLMATVSFILFISSRCKNQMAVMSLALFTCILPVFLSSALPDTIGIWFHCIWPTGAIGLQNSILYDFTGYDYLTIGSFTMWTPYVIMIAAIVEVPLFIALAIRSYNHYNVR